MSGAAVTVVTLSAEALAHLVEEASERGAARALSQAEADRWLDGKAAAKHWYGAEGKDEAWVQLRRRRPEIDAASVGTGKQRRWRRSALDQVLAGGLPLRRSTNG